MKRCFAILLSLLLVLSLGTLGASAHSFEAWSDVTLEVLYEQLDAEVLSPLAEDYSAWWWDDEVPELDNYATAATLELRGFAVSPDGEYAYLGTLNGGSGVRGAVVMNLLTGEVTDLYYRYDGEAGLDGSPFSYAKGIAADDRGYVYVGFAFSHNYNVVNLGIAEQQDDGTLEEVWFDSVYAFGDPGDQGGIKVGVNGVDVVKIGDSYYCYIMTNYKYDTLYCYDVTDPANPKPNKDFGDNGAIYFNEDDCPVKTDDFTLDEGQYMDVDEDGVIWLCAEPASGDAGIMKIDADGGSCVEFIPVPGAYSVSHGSGYLLVGLKDGSAIKVLDDASYEEIASITMPDAYNERVAYVTEVNDVLMAVNCSKTTINAILYAPLSMDGQAYINDIAARLNGEVVDTEPAETNAPADDPVEDVTVAGDETGASQETAEEVTEAPVEDATNAAETAAPATQETSPASKETAADTSAATDKAPAEKESEAESKNSDNTAEQAQGTAADTSAPAEGGCASAVIMGALLPTLLAGACVLSKKRRD